MMKVSRKEERSRLHEGHNGAVHVYIGQSLCLVYPVPVKGPKSNTKKREKTDNKVIEGTKNLTLPKIHVLNNLRWL